MKAHPILYLFRMQDSTGRGPWKPGFSYKWADADKKYLPAVQEEFGDMVAFAAASPGCCGTGCESLDHLRQWFSEREYRILLSFGYNAVRMSVDEIIAKSAIQSLFVRALPLNQGCEVVRLYEDSE